MSDTDPLQDGYRYNGEDTPPLYATGEPTLAPAEAYATYIDRNARPESPQPKRRPVIIDENDGPCEICAARRNGVCDECGLDAKETNDGLACGFRNDHTKHIGNSGFESPRPSHYHLVPIQGINGRRAFWAELCYNCYRAAYISQYGKDPFVS